MKPLKDIINKLYFNNHNCYLLLLIVAVLIAIRVMQNTHGWVNTDSLLYFEQARLISNFSFSEAYQLFQWPLYASILGLTHYLTHLDIQFIAQIWNTIFFGLFCLGFFKLITHLGGNKTTLLLSALLIFSNQYIVGDILPMLLRDEGFWAAFIWGLLFFIRFYQDKLTKDAFLFQVCFILATLFRIEAIAYLFALPLILLFESTHTRLSRVKALLTSTHIILLIAIGLVAAMILGLVDTSQIGRLQELNFSDGRNNIFLAIHQKAEVFGKEVLGDYLDNYALQCLLISYFWIIMVKAFNNVTGLVVLLIIYFGRSRLTSINAKAMQTLIISIVVGFIVAYVIMLRVSLLSSRYVIAIGIVMLILGSFALTHLIETLRSKWIKYSLITLLGLMLIANLYDRNHIDLDREVVNYMESLKVAHANVFYDTENARYYAHQLYQDRILETELVNSKMNNGELFKYPYIVITLDHDQTEYESSVKNRLRQYQEIKTIFGWKQKTKAIIFKKIGE
jgi:hypothetical protein